ncbi:hypothetical protein BJ138DRAFT_1112278 [Hygrophoropsis aurantiaca]|uniref:Uncharacterized protein n=1 Tax=Hygrophoropsis aurantiaca TaxID=72124 RepID=A0ACB8AHR5_9AGAM|nr:hypothetical protein BJ138DRAFT_1112278 [Hygrophoropsis aurantiaca]
MKVTAQNINQVYDFVIVGGGTSGLCLAARLSEEWNVLLIEAGEESLDDPLINMPAQCGAHFGKKGYDWIFQTIAQQYCGDSVVFWPRGKILGGSSAINFMVWTKPPSEHIDDLEILGNKGWNWDSVNKYMRKAEGFSPPPAEVAELRNLNVNEWKEDAGLEGPLKTGFPATITPVEIAAYKSFLALGIPQAKRPLGGDPNGAQFVPNTIDTSKNVRSYATTAYYLPNIHKKSFSVLLASNVSQILLEDDDGSLKATGVEFFCDGKKYEVKAQKEVLVCAGALKSPQLLELSGIGRPEILKSIGIPLKLELPGVGQNVQEHMIVGMSFELNENVKDHTFDHIRDNILKAEHIQLHKQGRGVFTMGVQTMVYTSLQSITDRATEIYQTALQKIGNNPDSYPPGLHAQLMLQLKRIETQSPICEIVVYPGFMSAPNPPEKGKNYVTIVAALNNNLSRGTIHSVSSNWETDPAFDPHYFEEDADLEILVETMLFIRKLANTEPFKNSIAQELNPGPEVSTVEGLKKHAKTYLNTTFHTAGSLSMLPLEHGGVVDSKLKVYGVDNLRVVDLSVLPLHFTAHTQAVVYGIAEKAADIIKLEESL